MSEMAQFVQNSSFSTIMVAFERDGDSAAQSVDLFLRTASFSELLITHATISDQRFSFLHAQNLRRSISQRS